MAIIQRLIPQRLKRIAAPYGGWRMLLRSLIYPRTFSEKVQRTKIFNRDPRLPQRENKILVKDLVSARLGREWVTPTLWQGEYLPPVEQRTWPIPFVIKANNGCGWNIFVRREPDLNWSRIESLAIEWRRVPFGSELGEWLYGEIEQLTQEEVLSSPPVSSWVQDTWLDQARASGRRAGARWPFWEHRILLSNGWEMKLSFHDVEIEEYEDVLMPVAGNSRMAASDSTSATV